MFTQQSFCLKVLWNCFRGSILLENHVMGVGVKMSIQGSVSKKRSSESMPGKGQLLILFLQVPEGKF